MVSDKFKQKYDARVNKAGIIEANLAGSVKAAEMISFGDINLAVDITKITGMQKNVEVINGRAAMMAFSGLVTHAQLFPDMDFPYGIPPGFGA